MATLTVLVDNEAEKPLKEAWGLSILVEIGNLKVLWDTGPDPKVLKYNASVLGKDLTVDYLVLSHRHWDHVGGISVVNYGKAIVPSDPLFPEVPRSEVNDKVTKLAPNVIITRPLKDFDIWEQGLVVIGEKRSALLVGCSHPGVTNIYKSVIEDIGMRPEVVIGGFHLYGLPRKEVERTLAKLKELGAKEIHPIHCSGNYAKQLAKVRTKAGSVLRL
ncbi:beta-lactamase [Ignicoccus islandicus DSM 13165]|uniref:Beta-lactamase n=1 Tax=Ignicoccus islandicus DSM 13165 TaxID=940295 RepID=A0A0U3EBV1_9CREN|nr:MBL fold metallo-hydrolase [Ignicoccus islandicus]ALU11939.1 beta-lactamase [Ignicoccus islandicus DSM 13165]